MGGAGRIGALVGFLVVGGCTWIPLDGPLGRNKPGDGDADVDTDADADTDTGSEPETGGTGDTGIETSPGTVDGKFDLANARTLFVGERPEDHTSMTLATNGDLTGDGVTDLVIGSWWSDVGDGSAYVVSADTVGRVDLADADAELTGGDGIRVVGCSVAVGDLDGDSHDDVLIGAYDAAFIVQGPVSGNVKAADVAMARFERAAGDRNKCFTVTAAGDINTDADEDLLIALEDIGENTVSVYVADAFTPSTDLDDLPDRVEGTVESLGGVTSVDLDSDGIEDVLLGDYRVDDVGGRVSLVPGPIQDVVSMSDAAAQLLGPYANSAFGLRLSDAGDLNGDGRPDLMVGAPGAAQEPPLEGSAFLWTSEMVGIMPATTADATIEGVEPGSVTGGSVSSAGDVDGDGFADVMVGVPMIGWASADFGFGAVYLLHGPFSGSVDLEEAIVLSGDRTLPLGVVGMSLAALGDVDADGLDDLAVGGWGIEGNRGGTYLVFGGDL